MPAATVNPEVTDKTALAAPPVRFIGAADPEAAPPGFGAAPTGEAAGEGPGAAAEAFAAAAGATPEGALPAGSVPKLQLAFSGANVIPLSFCPVIERP